MHASRGPEPFVPFSRRPSLPSPGPSGRPRQGLIHCRTPAPLVLRDVARKREATVAKGSELPLAHRGLQKCQGTLLPVYGDVAGRGIRTDLVANSPPTFKCLGSP